MAMERSIEEIRTAAGEKFLEISLEPENGWIRCTWFGNASIADISRGSGRYAEILSATGCPKLLNDNTRFEANWVAFNDELEQGRLQQAYKNGLRYLAHVHSSRFITRFSAVDLGTRITNFEFKLFEQLADAEHWLRTIDDE